MNKPPADTKPAPSPASFAHSLLATKEDIDEMGHVNNVVYVRWIQEVAAAHWASAATPAMKQNYLWVVVRHEVDYLSPAFEGDTITGTTWVGEATGARSERYVELTRKETGKVLIKAKTTWCMLDAVTLKPKRVDPEIMQLLKT